MRLRSCTAPTVASAGTVTTVPSPATSSKVDCDISSAPASCAELRSSRSPVSAECRTSSRRSSGLCSIATSSTGSTPVRRTRPLAASLSSSRTGRKTHMKARIGRARRIAERSGWVIAHDLGAISPTTRCRNVTRTRASPNETATATACGRPSASSSGSNACSTAGSVTAPRARVQAVMPSWVPASSTETSEALRSAARADLLVTASSSRRVRRAAIVANSMETKNALAAMITIVTGMATRPSISGPPPRDRTAPVRGARDRSAPDAGAPGRGARPRAR